MKKFEKIILVDDDTVINFINEKTIKLTGIAEEIETFTNSEDTLNYLKENSDTADKSHTSNIIFLDLNMPGIDGWEFLDTLNEFPKEFKQTYKIFILSSSIDPMDMEKAKNYEIVEDFISKPLTKQQLIQMGENSRN